MAEYKVNQSYRARRDGQEFGPYDAGTTVELDDHDAAWVERDSPGTLTPLDIAADTETSKVDADGEAEPAKDRQHKGGRKRS